MTFKGLLIKSACNCEDVTVGRRVIAEGVLMGYGGVGGVGGGGVEGGGDGTCFLFQVIYLYVIWITT